MNDPKTADDSLKAQLLAPDTFDALVADCCKVMESEVRRRGMAVRTAFGVATRVKPDLLEQTVRELMPAFVAELEPSYQDFRAQGGGDFERYLKTHDGEAADAMLKVADARAERIQSRPIRSAYGRLRGRARREIIDTMPQIAATLGRHVD